MFCIVERSVSEWESARANAWLPCAGLTGWLAGWLPARPPRETERARERESESTAGGGVIMKPANIARASGLQENSKHVRDA